MHKSRPNRTAQAPYGRTCPPVAPLPSPRRFASACAFGGAPLRGSPGFAGSPSGNRAGLRPGRLPKARHAAPVAAPPPAPTSSTVPAERPQKRFSREKRLAEARAHIERQRGRKGRKLNAKRRAGSQAAELASIAISDEAGPEPRPGRAGAPRRPETGRGSGLGAADHGKRLYGPSRAEFRLSHARSRAGPGPSRSIPL